MRQLMRAACVLAVSATLSWPALAAPLGTEAADLAWVKAMKANDIDGIVRVYAPDAIVWLPEMKEARGEKAIRATYESLLSGHTVKDVALKETGYRTTGKHGVGWGRYELTLQPKAGGAPTTLTGRFLAYSQLRNGRWVYVVDHASADPEPPKK